MNIFFFTNNCWNSIRKICCVFSHQIRKIMSISYMATQQHSTHKRKVLSLLPHQSLYNCFVITFEWMKIEAYFERFRRLSHEIHQKKCWIFRYGSPAIRSFHCHQMFCFYRFSSRWFESFAFKFIQLYTARRWSNIFEWFPMYFDCIKYIAMHIVLKSAIKRCVQTDWKSWWIVDRRCRAKLLSQASIFVFIDESDENTGFYTSVIQYLNNSWSTCCPTFGLAYVLCIFINEKRAFLSESALS